MLLVHHAPGGSGEGERGLYSGAGRVGGGHTFVAGGNVPNDSSDGGTGENSGLELELAVSSEYHQQKAPKTPAQQRNIN